MITKELMMEHACMGLAWEVHLMRETPDLNISKALKRIEDELVRIARGDVSDEDLIG